MTDDSLTAALDRLSAINATATQGRWVSCPCGCGGVLNVRDAHRAVNGAYVDAVRTALPALVDAVRAVLALAPVAEDEPSWYGAYGYEDASGRYDGLVEAVAAVTAALAPLTAAHTEAQR